MVFGADALCNAYWVFRALDWAAQDHDHDAWDRPG